MQTLLRSKENWMILVACSILMFHRYLGLATMFGIDSVWMLPFDIKNRANVSIAVFGVAVVPLGILENHMKNMFKWKRNNSRNVINR